MKWSQRDGGGYIANVEGLGLVEIYRDKGGNCVDINGKRAWSAWKESQEMMKYSVADMLWNWQYINTLRE